MELELKELQSRWNHAWEAKSEEITKHSLINLAIFEYEKHLRNGEVWGESFRFPELFGLKQRKFDNLIEFFPELRIRGENDSTLALEASLTHVKRISNFERERNRALEDTISYGVGCIFAAPVRYERKVRTKKGVETVLAYDGLGAERIDYRDIFPAASALVMHDHTGETGCPFLFRRRIFYFSTFKQKYGKKPFDQKIVDAIVPTSFGQGFADDRTPTQKESKEKTQGEYVTSHLTVNEHDLLGCLRD